MLSGATLVFLFSACSPRFNWRQVQGNDAPFSVLMPAKPSTFSRPIDLNGIKVSMTMTATEIDGVVFAVGSARLTDPAQASTALQAMKTALVNNINGSIKSESAHVVAGNAQATSAITLEAVGPPENGSQPKALFAHLEARGQYIYQAIVIGPQKNITSENVEMFLQSFKAT
ncbi:hypothetical protein HAV38_00860 [Glaciimonas immobilis]|nr:hypothetical protein HAV38_00860 [Glaciimonas immobilis]